MCKIIPKFASKLILGVIILSFGLITEEALAQKSKPVQVSIINPVQLFNEDTSIKGIRLNLLYGKNESMHGLDVGLVNQVGNGGFKGMQYGFVNITDAEAKGLQLGVVNFNKGNTVGLQWGGVNTSPDMKGFQYGVVNHAGNMRGFQLGFINYAEAMDKGLQIGLLNIIREGGKFPVFPIINWSI